MRILHLSTYDLFGGAARAAFRLHVGLRAAGEESTMLVRQRQSSRDDVAQPMMRSWLRLQRRIDRAPLWFKPPSARGFSIGWAPGVSGRAIAALKSDVVHVHWTADGFMRPEAIAGLAAPVVWTMHDMWAFTGGCHYAGPCTRFTDACGRCPLLGNTDEQDFSRRGWQRRREAMTRKRIVFVAPSRWMANEARRSSLLREAEIVVIPNGFDTDRFAPRERAAARHTLGLAPDAVLAMTGAAQLNENPRKGFGDLVAALERLRGKIPSDGFELVTFGSETAAPTSLAGFRVRNLGVIDDEHALVAAYAAADIFVAPSRADNLPNTIIEAMAVGVPAIGYDVGGIPDIIDHDVNGLLASPAQPEALAEALARLVNDVDLRGRLGRAARAKTVREFSIGKCVAEHETLYRRVAGHA